MTPHRTIALNGPLQIVLQVTRSKAAKMFVVLVAVSNCKINHKFWFIYNAEAIFYNSQGLVTAAFLVISAAAVVYPNPYHYNEMFVLPVGVLFAFTSIRANLPGAPVGFGQCHILFHLHLSELSLCTQ